ncbi:response regulator [Sorangium sp. So ce1128]
MSRATAPGARTRTILIVDDTPANLTVLVDNLERVGHQVLIAQDSGEALERAGLMTPDLILLDVVMPDIDGFETCRRLKADESTRDIPVIFMTALADAADKLVGFKAGGVDYITKPFEIGEVLARVTTHLSLREAQKELEEKNTELQRTHQELEQRVRDRTAELARSNAALRESQHLLQAIPAAESGRRARRAGPPERRRTHVRSACASDFAARRAGGASGKAPRSAAPPRGRRCARPRPSCGRAPRPRTGRPATRRGRCHTRPPPPRGRLPRHGCLSPPSL